MWVPPPRVVGLFFTLLLTTFDITRGELEDGISYIVHAGKRDCFYKDVDQGFKMDFDLQVLGRRDLSIGWQPIKYLNLEIVNPDSKIP